MTAHEEVVQASDFKDRKVGLVIFGILQIFLGGICALLVALMIVGMAASNIMGNSSVSSMSVDMMIPGVLFYVLFAVWFICMGIGSIRAKRWTRALLLVSSWVWLISGLSGLIFMFLLMPDMFDHMARDGNMPEAIAKTMKYVIIAVLTFIYVVIPGALVLFYGSKNVKATCAFRNPRICWTDKCPLPVLAISLMSGIWAFSMPVIGFYGWAIPFFGVILSGTAGALVALSAMALFAYVARGTYKLNIKAWWVAVLLIGTWGLSTVITFSRVSMGEFYEKMNLPEQQLEVMQQYNSMPSGVSMIVLTGLWFIAFLGFLLYIKKYFKSAVEKA